MINVRVGSLNTPTDDPFLLLFPDLQKAVGVDSVLQHIGVLAALDGSPSKFVLVFQDPSKPKPQLINLSSQEVAQIAALINYVQYVQTLPK